MLLLLLILLTLLFLTLLVVLVLMLLVLIFGFAWRQRRVLSLCWEEGPLKRVTLLMFVKRVVICVLDMGWWSGVRLLFLGVNACIAGRASWYERRHAVR